MPSNAATRRTFFEYEVGDPPYGRLYSEDLRCPFCGARKVIIGYEDEKDDSGRLDLYCDNQECEVRTFVVLAQHIGRPNDRADVIALQTIDAGVGDERLPETVNLMNSDDNAKVEAHDAGKLHRRTREARIEVIPGPRF